MRTQLQTFGGDDPLWAFVGRLRAERFTGAATLRGPQIDLFATDGHVYLAERRGEPALPQRLLAAGVVTSEQLERGTVEVAGVRSLARLFHREPTVDRDLVELFVQLATDAVLAESADAPVGPVDVAHLLHHSSGVHLWARVSPPAPSDHAEQADQADHAEQAEALAAAVPAAPHAHAPWAELAVEPAEEVAHAAPELHLEDLHLAEPHVPDAHQAPADPQPRPIESFLSHPPQPEPLVAEPVEVEPVVADAMLEAFAEMETLGPITTSIPVLPPIPPIPSLPAEAPTARPAIPPLSTPPAPLVPPMPATAPAVDTAPAPVALSVPVVPAAPAAPSAAPTAVAAAPRTDPAAPADQIWQLVDGLNVPPPPAAPAPVATDEHESRRGWRRNKKG